MAEREPLRVGPLVLSALRNGGTFETCEIFAGLALIRLGLATEEPFKGSPFGALKLTQAGKLVAAQYRSRRRLLVRDLESLAQRYRRHADIQRGWVAQAHRDDRERLGRMVTSSESRAAKYARWAERLRNG